VFLVRFHDSGSCREFETVMFGGISSPWGVHHLPKISSQDSKWFGRSVDRKFGAVSQAFSCHRVFIGSTDTRSVVPIVGCTNLVPKVPIT
jgi:hypothetical protein